MKTNILILLPALLLAATFFASCSRPGNTTAHESGTSSLHTAKAEATHAASHGNCPVPFRCSPVETPGNPWAAITGKGAENHSEAVAAEVARRESNKQRRAYSFAFGC